jgi:hypothetical protein
MIVVNPFKYPAVAAVDRRDIDLANYKRCECFHTFPAPIRVGVIARFLQYQIRLSSRLQHLAPSRHFLLSV